MFSPTGFGWNRVCDRPSARRPEDRGRIASGARAERKRCRRFGRRSSARPGGVRTASESERGMKTEPAQRRTSLRRGPRPRTAARRLVGFVGSPRRDEDGWARKSILNTLPGPWRMENDSTCLGRRISVLGPGLQEYGRFPGLFRAGGRPKLHPAFDGSPRPRKRRHAGYPEVFRGRSRTFC